MDFGFALQHAVELRAKVSRLELALSRAPADAGLRLTLLSLQRRLKRAEHDMEEAAKNASVDLIRYHVEAEDSDYSVNPISNSLGTYQGLFTAVYAFIRRGAQWSAKYSDDIKERSRLNIGYIYPGSLGVVLTVENNRDMFNVGEMDRMIDGFRSITEMNTVSKVKEVAKTMGMNVVRNSYKWASANLQSRYAVGLQWRRSDEMVSGGVIPVQSFGDMATAISQTSDDSVSTRTVNGVLAGYNVIRKSFTFVSDEDETFSGSLLDVFERKEYAIPRRYLAQMQVTTTVSYITDEVSESYRLVYLRDI